MSQQLGIIHKTRDNARVVDGDSSPARATPNKHGGSGSPSMSGIASGRIRRDCPPKRSVGHGRIRRSKG